MPMLFWGGGLEDLMKLLPPLSLHTVVTPDSARG